MRQRNTGGGKGTDTFIASIGFSTAARHHRPSEQTPRFTPGKPVLPVAKLPV